MPTDAITMKIKEQTIDTDSYRAPKPSFIGGMAKVLDLGNTLSIYDKKIPSQLLDFEALKHDWEKVGEDLYSSINIYERTTETIR